MTTLKTQRLTLRPFTNGDHAFILRLLNTDEWIRYIGNRNVKTREQAENYLENGPLKSYRENGFGLCMVELQNGEPIGMCGLLKRDYLGYPDIGFAFLPEHGKKGYAFEIASATVEHGLNVLKLKKILAITLPQNKNSVQLLKKLGFVFEKNIADKGEELMLFGIENKD